MKILLNRTLYLLLGAIPFIGLVSCGDDDEVNASTLVPALALSTVIEEYVEGDEATLEVGYFGSDSLTSAVNVQYSITGAITQTGTVTIPAGSLTADIDIAVTDDLLANGARSLTVTLTGGDVALADPTINPTLDITADVAVNDDVISFGVEEEAPIVVTETDTVSIPLSFTGNGGIDEVLTITYTIDGANTTAAAGDYEITPASPFTWDPEVDTLADFPSLQIIFTDDLATNAADTLDLRVAVDVDGSDEVILIDTLDNFIDYRLLDDLKTVSFSGDTLYLDSAAIAASSIFTVGVGLDREVLSDATATYTIDAPLTLDGTGTSVFSPGITSADLRVSAAGIAFNPTNTEADTTYYDIDIATFTAASNGDAELRISTTSGTYVVGVIDPEAN